MQKTNIKIYILSRAERKSYKVERVLEFYATADMTYAHYTMYYLYIYRYDVYMYNIAGGVLVLGTLFQ